MCSICRAYGAIEITRLDSKNIWLLRSRSSVLLCNQRRVVFHKIKNIFVLKGDVEFAQQSQIFILERFLLMMDFLILDVANHHIQLRMTVGKGSEAFLPMEFAANPTLFVDEFRGTSLDVSHQIGQSDAGFQADQQMYVIGYAVDLQHLLFLIGDDAGDVLVQLFFEGGLNQALSALHSKDYLKVNL